MLAAARPTRSSSSKRTIRVLLAEDHPVMRESLVSLLEAEPDIEVVAEAANGREAVELVSQHEPDVVLMDVTMPVMNGTDATRHISREWPEIRIIGLSVHQHADMSTAMLHAGAQTYLTKDGPPEDLIAAIRAP